jgi:hypothetical protein
MQNNVGIYASQISGHLYDGPFGAYDSLATVTLSAATSSVTFAGIPSGYKHLQIRALFQPDTDGEQLFLRFNGDSSANYTYHQLVGDGSAASAAAGTGSTGARTAVITNGNSSTFGGGVVDILDYANTNKYKTVRSFGGGDTNSTAGIVVLRSNLWLNTSAITSIECRVTDGSNMSIYTSLALYGVK